ncbi:hypothetical protein [Rhizobacter sp. OV335]|jgi:hypothetical protein|uniref:hypothetical protein n=1 Tax=Rhizobacter sp. OV335 TaxID=1500264 RepID=UPI00090F9643|nr:hypothetical protein [Rhizobacter sp. OV335]SHM87252.1 hypothetical protein SAMN02787076_02469 [Rhizobacter sp. OV335]
MEMTPRRRELIEAHVADTRAQMTELAFELNDLVRFALSAAKPKGNKLYYPMDPVNEGIRNWKDLQRKLAKLTARVDQGVARLGVQPFDPEAPAQGDVESSQAGSS